MAYTYQIPNLTGGFDDAIIGTASSVSWFIPGLLIFVYFVVLLGGAVSQKRRIGYSDIPFWSVLAFLSTLMVALPLTIKSGFIDITVLSVLGTVGILSGFWFFMNKSRNET